MTKKEIVAKAADTAGISKAKAEIAVNAAFDEITETLKRGDKVTFVGFGTFSTSFRKHVPAVTRAQALRLTSQPAPCRDSRLGKH